MRPRIIGVAGGSGSGKSTLAVELARRLPGAALVELDWYYRDLSGLAPEERETVNFDHPDALDWPLCLEQVRLLAAGRPVRRPVYDFAAHTRVPGTLAVEPAGAVVVEGLLALHHDGLRAFWDLAVFVALDEERRFARRLERDVAERGRSPESVREQLERTVRPMHDRFVEPSRAHADAVADGSADPAAEAARVLDLLETKLRGARKA